MRVTLVGLNLAALAGFLAAAWLIFNATQQFAPVSDIGRTVLYWVFGVGAVALLIAVIQFAGRRRMHAWGAITPMVVGSLLLVGGFAWLMLNATLPR